MSGLFTRIAHHARSSERDPREDRLTEICAAVFESPHCPGLARHVAIAWLREAETAAPGASAASAASRLRQLLADDAPEWSCDVTTQVYTVVGDETRRPDLELTFQAQTGSAQEVSIWVEGKHGTAPHDRQLWSYLKAQQLQGITRGIVLLVAPRASYPFEPDELPPPVPQLTWEHTTAAISVYDPHDAVGQFLVDETCHYLKGEGLMDPDRVTPLHLVALANYREALRALEALCNATAEKVANLWNASDPPYESTIRGDARTVWQKNWAYPTSRRGETPALLPEAWRAWGLSWGRFIDSAQLLRDGRPVYHFSLLGWGRSSRAAWPPSANMGRIASATSASGSYASSAKTRNEFIWRVGYPEDLLRAATWTRRPSRSQSGWWAPSRIYERS
jgi:hypothetical protein